MEIGENMADYFGLILTGFFTGIGVIAGQEVYNWIKNRREKAKHLIKTYAQLNK